MNNKNKISDRNLMLLTSGSILSIGAFIEAPIPLLAAKAVYVMYQAGKEDK